MNQSSGVRISAVRDLLRIELGGAYISKVRQSEQDAAQARRVRDLVAGVTRWRRYLDFLLQAHYKGRLRKIEPLLRQILRIAVYECHVLERAPHAVVSRAVQLAKDHVRPGAGRLVNAILRNMLRAPLPEPDTGGGVDDLATRYSHPTWMVRRWVERWGFDSAQALMIRNNQRPWYGLRCNLMRGSREALQERLTDLGVHWEPGAYLDDFLRVAQVGPIQRAGLLADGLCAVQDEGAGLVVRLLDPQPGEDILDLCAAPGGKALYAAARMQDKGHLLAFDRHENRLSRLSEAAQAQRITIVEPRTVDARTTTSVFASRVLVDAPCTGTGVLSKRADLRWRRGPEDLDRIIQVQDQLLDAAARCVRPGGVLIYSTCSIETEENEARAEAFLRRHPTFVAESAEAWLPQDVVTKDGNLHTIPSNHLADGTFAVRMRRT